MTRNRKTGAGPRGAAMVEMALLLPVLLGLVMGIIEFGMIGHHKLTLVQATRAA